MKKKFTILSILTVATSLSFAQTIPSFPAAQKKANKIAIQDPKNVIYGTTPKDGGDVIWDDDFGGTETWTLGSEPGSTQGTWVIGAYPTQFAGYMGAMTNATAPLASFNGIQHLLAASASNPVGVQNVWIASPTIDFSPSASGIITVSFNQRYRRFNHDVTYVEVSDDNGATWESFQVNTQAVGNGATIQNTEVIDIPVGTGVTQGKIRFRWESLTADNQFGSGYGWAIDNVVVKEGYINNLQLFQTFTTVGAQMLSYTKMPTVQAAAAGEMTFGAIAKNTGSATQDVILTVENGSYSEDSPEVTIATFERDTLSIETNGFTIPSAVGVANFTFSVSSADSTLDVTGDDSQTVPFEVTNKIYAADAYNGTAASFGSSFNGWQNGTGDAEIGTFFEIFANQTLHAIQVGIGSVPTANQATYNGRVLVAKLYEVPAGSSEPILIDATQEYAFVPNKPSQFGGLMKLYFTSGIPLDAGSTYLVTASTFVNEAIPIAFSGNVIAGNVMGKDGDSFVGLAADDILGNVVPCPVIRMDFTDYTGVEELAAQFNVNAYPNPFSAATEVAFELKNESSVSIKVTDVTGREVMDLGTANYKAGAHKVSVNGAELNAGIYNVTMTVGNNVITKRIVKK